MKAKKIISILLTALLALTMLTTGVLADTQVTYTIGTVSAKTGTEVDVPLNITANLLNGFGCIVTYDSTLLTYVSYANGAKVPFKDKDAKVLEVSTGKIEIIVIADEMTFTNSTAFTLKFKAADTIEGTSKDAEIKVSYFDEMTTNGEDLGVPEADQVFVNGKVAIKTTHTAPDVKVKIDGDAIIGKTLTANTDGTTDSWGLTPTWAYQWMADGAAIEGATDKTYAVKADDFGKKLSVKATATVDADENTTGSATSAETAAVIADAAAKASVANVKLDSDVVAVGAPVMVKYDFTASINGGEDKSEIAWTAEDGSALKGTVSEDGKTFTAAIEDLGKKVKVTVTPKGDRDTAKGDAVSFTSEAIVAGNPTATNVKASVSSIRVNKAFTVEYTYSDPKNGGEEAAGIYAEDKEKTVVAYTLYKDAGLTEAVDKADYAKYITVEDGKYTASADAKNLYIVFEVTPVNKAGIAGKTEKSEAYKITKKSSSGNDGPTSIIGGKPTTSPEPTTSPDPTKDPNAVTGGKDEIVLVINNKNASVWGEAKTNDVAPIIRKDRTMLPARFVAEALGAEVSWDEAARKVTIVSADKATTIVITIDSDKAMVNDKEVKLDSAAFIENDRTYTPIRFISESLGAKVAWDEAAQKVTITK